MDRSCRTTIMEVETMNETEVHFKVYYTQSDIVWYTDPILDYDEAVSFRNECQKNKYMSNVVIVKETITKEIIA